MLYNESVRVYFEHKLHSPCAKIRRNGFKMRTVLPSSHCTEYNLYSALCWHADNDEAVVMGMSL